jgi:hypothetical protein
MKEEIIKEFRNVQAAIGLIAVGFSIMISGIKGLSGWLTQRTEYDGWPLLLIGAALITGGVVMFRICKKKIIGML